MARRRVSDGEEESSRKVNLAVRILLGLVAITPLFAIVVFFGAFVYLIQADERWFIELIMRDERPLLLINLVLLVLTNGPLIAYIILAAKNKELADRKGVWIVLIVLLGVFTMPLYWFLFVWRDSYYER